MKKKENNLRNLAATQEGTLNMLNIFHQKNNGIPLVSSEKSSKNGQKYNAKTKQEVINAITNGMQYRNAKEIYGVSVSTICLWMRAHKAGTTGEQSVKNPNKAKQYTDAEKKAAVKLYESGMSVRKVEAKTGVGRSTILTTKAKLDDERFFNDQSN